MQENYKPIGDYIRVVNLKNRDLAVKQLIGLSIDKCYIPSVANVIGTDLSTYKIIKRNQFACSLMQVSRDEKIPIACMMEYDEAIMSPAYVIFEIIDESALMPEYLNMWVMRAEFDREASFLAVGGVRGSLAWDDFCRMKLPVPSIDEQRKIVKAYQTITDRIKLKKQINDNLANTEQAILVEAINNSATAPITFGEIAEFIDGDRGKNYPTFDEFTTSGYCLFLNASNVTADGFNFDTCMFITKEKDEAMNKGHLSRNDIVLTSRGTLGNVALYDEYIRFENVRINSGMLIIRPRVKNISHYLIYALLRSGYMKAAIEKYRSGSAQPQLPIKDLQKISFNIPQTTEKLNDIDRQFKSIEKQIALNNQEIESLKELCAVLLAELSR